jgi:hypothetical protein
VDRRRQRRFQAADGPSAPKRTLIRSLTTLGHLPEDAAALKAARSRCAPSSPTSKPRFECSQRPIDQNGAELEKLAATALEDDVRPDAGFDARRQGGRGHSMS